MKYPDYSKLSKDKLKRIAKLDKIEIWYPEIVNIREQIKRIYALRFHTKQPQCIAIIGDTGVGKTFIAEYILTLNEREITETGTIDQIIYILVPGRPTLTGFLKAVLRALGDPFPYGNDPAQLEHRVIELLKDCGTQLLLLDEMNHFTNDYIHLTPVSDALKNILKATGISCAIFGMPDTNQLLTSNNDQLNRLFGQPIVLEHLKWESYVMKQGEGEKHFRKFVSNVENLLTLNKADFMSTREYAWRLYCASMGKQGHIMTILKGAAEKAIVMDKDRLSIDLLASAYDEWIPHDTYTVSKPSQNPFTGKLPTKPKRQKSKKNKK